MLINTPRCFMVGLCVVAFAASDMGAVRVAGIDASSNQALAQTAKKRTSSKRRQAKQTAKLKSGGSKETQKPVQPSEPVPDDWPEAQQIEALKACVRILADVKADVGAPRSVRAGDCGSPAMVELRAIETSFGRVRFSRAIDINCAMVPAIAKWLDGTVQPAAKNILGARVKRLVRVGGYTCRNVNGAKSGRRSQHAFGNALDVGAFELANGRRVNILKDWGPTKRDAPPTTERAPRSVAGALTKPIRTAPSRREAKAEPAIVIAAFGTPPIPAARLDAFGLRPPVRNPERIPAARAKREARDRPVWRAKIAKRSALDASKTKTSRLVLARAPSRRVVGAPTVAAKRSSRQPRRSSKRRTPNALKPTKPLHAQFLKKIHADACPIFGTVLGPEANEAHRDHFHLDLAPRRRKNYCR